MKKLKLFLIVAIVATAMMNYASAEGFKSKPAMKLTDHNVVKNLTLLEAIQVPGLVSAMYRQLSGGFLGGPGIHYYTFSVKYQKDTYMITGTYDQWSLFFNRNSQEKVSKYHNGRRAN